MKAIKRKSFTFDVEWIEILAGFPSDVKYEVYDAIMEYALSGTLSDMKPMAKAVFNIIKKRMDEEFARQSDISAKRAEAGRRAMEIRYGKTNDIKSEQVITSDNNCLQVIANVTKNQPINNNIINNISSNIERKESISKDIPKKREKSAAKAAPTDIELRKSKFYESLVPFVGQYPKDMIRAFFDYWSEMNKSCTKMRFELERTWEITRRLRTWASRDKSFQTSSMELGTVLRDNSTDKYQNEEKWNR